MRLSLLRKFKLLVIRLFLELLLFIDFLEAMPVNSAKLFVKALGAIFFVAFVVGFLILESKQNTVHNLLVYTLFPRARVFNLASINVPEKPNASSIEFPPISARSYIIVDLKRQKVLKEYNSRTPLPPASTTKIMTALVARDIYDLSDMVLIPEECTKLETQRIGFIKDEKLSVEDLLGTLLVNSAGDSACALANGKVAYEEFVTLMNLKAISLGLTSTNFSNPIGFDDFSENHLISANDLYQLAVALRKDPVLKAFVSMHEYTLQSEKSVRIVPNTNILLWEVPGSVGIKTGKTYGAGEVLVYEYLNNSNNFLIVVMGSLDRFKDTKAILNWTLQTY